MTQKKTLRRLHFDIVEHKVKVTRIKGKGWGVRVYTNGVLSQEDVVRTQLEIGPAARGMLRMEDKCGNPSKYADRARHRTGEKLIRRSE